MENKSNSFVVTLTPITESSDLTIQGDHTDIEEKVASLPTPKQNLVKSAVKQVLESKRNQE